MEPSMAKEYGAVDPTMHLETALWCVHGSRYAPSIACFKLTSGTSGGRSHHRLWRYEVETAVAVGGFYGFEHTLEEWRELSLSRCDVAFSDAWFTDQASALAYLGSLVTPPG
jgi:hypothetical protein